jgi:hypothetical protein
MHWEAGGEEEVWCGTVVRQEREALRRHEIVERQEREVKRRREIVEPEAKRLWSRRQRGTATFSLLLAVHENLSNTYIYSMSYCSSFHYNCSIPSFLNCWERVPVTEGTKMSSIPRLVPVFSNRCFLFLIPTVLVTL